MNNMQTELNEEGLGAADKWFEEFKRNSYSITRDTIIVRGIVSAYEASKAKSGGAPVGWLVSYAKLDKDFFLTEKEARRVAKEHEVNGWSNVECFPVYAAMREPDGDGWLPIDEAAKTMGDIFLYSYDNHQFGYGHWEDTSTEDEEFVKETKGGSLYKKVLRKSGYWSGDNMYDVTHYMLPNPPAETAKENI